MTVQSYKSNFKNNYSVVKGSANNHNVGFVSIKQDIPYISIYKFDTVVDKNTSVVIPYYATDYRQTDYDEEICKKLKLKYQLDGGAIYSQTITSGDNELDLGVCDIGEHEIEMWVEDGKYASSRTLQMFMVKESLILSESEIYTVTDDDLISYNINKNNSDIEDDMVNTLNGINSLLSNIKNEGYKGCKMVQGTYRINSISRDAGQYINMPTEFTLDLNGSVVKQHTNDASTGMMIMFNGVKDSHVINGTLEGNYREREAAGYIDGGQGEGVNTIMFKGGIYNSLENLEVKNTTGHTTGAGMREPCICGDFLNWQHDISLIKGVEMTTDGVSTSDYLDMTSIIQKKTFIVGKYLGYQGMFGDSFDIFIHFYDLNHQYLYSLKSHEYNINKIPEGVKYIRVTIYGTPSNDLQPHERLKCFYMDTARNCIIKNVVYNDTRTTAIALGHHNNFSICGCTFDNCGQHITPSSIDLEDGWQGMQDFFLDGCVFMNRPGTADVILCAGFNHIISNCKSKLIIHIRKVCGYGIFNNNIQNLQYRVSQYKNDYMYSIRIQDNTFVERTEIDNNNPANNEFIASYVETKYDDLETNGVVIRYPIIKNNIFSYVKFNNRQIISGSTIQWLCSGGSNGQNNYDFVCIKDSTIKNCGMYFRVPVYIKNCVFPKTVDIEEIKFSFNFVNSGSPEMQNINNCTFDANVRFATHNKFQYGIFINNVFNGSVYIQCGVTYQDQFNKMGDIRFNNCEFNGIVSVELNNEYIQFNNCKFISMPIFKGKTPTNYEFNNCYVDDVLIKK